MSLGDVGESGLGELAETDADCGGRAAAAEIQCGGAWAERAGAEGSDTGGPRALGGRLS